MLDSVPMAVQLRVPPVFPHRSWTGSECPTGHGSRWGQSEPKNKPEKTKKKTAKIPPHTPHNTNERRTSCERGGKPIIIFNPLKPVELMRCHRSSDHFEIFLFFQDYYMYDNPDRSVIIWWYTLLWVWCIYIHRNQWTGNGKQTAINDTKVLVPPQTHLRVALDHPPIK